MTDEVPISGLPPGATLTGTEVLPVVQGGVTVQEPLSAVNTYILSQAPYGTAANKNATNNAEPLLASPVGTFSAGNIVIADDTSGSIVDAGLAPADLQPLSTNLTTLAQMSTAGGRGFITFRGAADFVQRTLTAGSSKISITNPQGLAGDPTFDVNQANLSIATSQITGAAALTKTDDTNVTLTLGGTPASALLQATSITAGWTGLLSGARGGTGVNNGSNTATYAGNLNFANSFTTSGNFAVTQTYTGATNVTFPTSGTLATVGSTIGTTLTSNTTLTSAQNGQLIPVNFTSAGTITVPKQATAALSAGYYVDLLNIGLTDVQINHEAGDVFEAQSYLLAPGASMRVSLKAAGTPNTWEGVGGTYLMPVSYNWSPFGTVTNATYYICNSVETDFVVTDLSFRCTSGSGVGTVASTTGNLTAFTFGTTSTTLAITSNASITQGSDFSIAVSSSSSLVNPVLTVRAYKRFNI